MFSKSNFWVRELEEKLQKLWFSDFMDDILSRTILDTFSTKHLKTFKFKFWFYTLSFITKSPIFAGPDCLLLNCYEKEQKYWDAQKFISKE
jgi:hypothetical protein